MAQSQGESPSVARFAAFELGVQSEVLRKYGVPLKLQGHPLQLLILLTERAGQIVSREDIRKALWNQDTFVDFERSINFCINQIRAALGDDAQAPRYIETVPRKGYRFIAEVTWQPPVSASLTRAAASDGLQTLATPPAHSGKPPKRLVFILAPLLAAGILLTRFSGDYSSPRVQSITQLTSDGSVKVATGPCCTTIVNDGSRIYFSEMHQGRWVLGQVSVTGRDVAPLPVPLKNVGLADISPLHNTLLLLGSARGPLWTLPVPGGPLQRLGEIVANDAAWSPDGSVIAFFRNRALYTVNADGSSERKLASFDRLPLRPRWSPDQSKLRFTLYEPRTGTQSLWEIAANGANPHALFPAKAKERNECCGAWTPDARYFVYQSTRARLTSIWAVREDRRLLSAASRQPVRLTDGPINFLGPSVSPDGTSIFVVGWQPRGELMRYDRTSGQFVTYLSGISGEGLDFSTDGRWVTYVSYPEGVLWKMSMGRGERIRLTGPGMWSSLPRWSPDQSRIVFTGSKQGGPMKAYAISADGGEPEQMIAGDGPEFDSSWSADGKSLVYADSVVAQFHRIHVLDVETRRVSALPGSEGLFSPRCSRDGRHLAALTPDSLSLKLYDMSTATWRNLVQGQHVAYPSFSSDGAYIYFSSPLEEKAPFYRVRISDRKLELVAALDLPKGLAPGFSGWWTGLSPDDSPILLRDTSIQELYTLSVKWP